MVVLTLGVTVDLVSTAGVVDVDEHKGTEVEKGLGVQRRHKSKPIFWRESLQGWRPGR